MVSSARSSNFTTTLAPKPVRMTVISSSVSPALRGCHFFSPLPTSSFWAGPVTDATVAFSGVAATFAGGAAGTFATGGTAAGGPANADEVNTTSTSSAILRILLAS